MLPRHLALLALGLVSACHGEGAAFTTSTSTSSSGPSSTGTTAEGTSSSAGSGVDASSTVTTSAGSTSVASSEVSTGEPTSTTLVHDVGSDKDLGGDGTPEGCKGKIDFLFVISRDINMYVGQDQLVDAFPKFISTISSKFEDFDYHIMVVDTDDYWGHPWQCTPVCPDLTCKIGDPCCPYDSGPKGQLCCPAPDYPCGDLDLVTACDETLGAGTVFNAGKYSSNEPCKVDGGLRYLTKGQTNLSDTFACIAQVGTVGSNQVGAALAAAVAPEINAPGGCNDGFLRDDALLMVTMITPAYDDSFTGSVEEWYQAVVAAKNGDPGAVVMLLIGNPVCEGDNRQCMLATMFPYHYLESNNAEDYGPAFDVAASKVATACQALVPG